MEFFELLQCDHGQPLEVCLVNHQMRWLPEEHKAFPGFEGFCNAENVSWFPARAGGERGECGLSSLLREKLQPGIRLSALQHPQRFKRGCVNGGMLERLVIQDSTAPYCCDGRELPNNKAVTQDE